MKMPAEFDEIRPYSPEELPQVFEELIADPNFRAVTESIIPDVPFTFNDPVTYISEKTNDELLL